MNRFEWLNEPLQMFTTLHLELIVVLIAERTQGQHRLTYVVLLASFSLGFDALRLSFYDFHAPIMCTGCCNFRPM